jgi:hypothetical protein
MRLEQVHFCNWGNFSAALVTLYLSKVAIFENISEFGLSDLSTTGALLSNCLSNQS